MKHYDKKMITLKGTRFFSGLIFLLISLHAVGQELTWKADRNRILIGQPVTCRLDMPLPADDASFTLKIPDSIPHFELIGKSGDARRTGKVFSGEWTFTSFDSGSWVLPAFQVLINQGGQEKTVYTDSIPVEVVFDPADSTGILRDIKPVMDVPVKDYTWYYIAGAALLLALLAWIYFRYFYRKRKTDGSPFSSALSPYEELLGSLDALQGKPLNTRMDHVYWHASLSGMLRRYASRKTGANRMSATTGDLLMQFGRNGLDKESLSKLAAILRTGDAVKFARYEPSADDTRGSLNSLRGIVTQIEHTNSRS